MILGRTLARWQAEAGQHNPSSSSYQSAAVVTTNTHKVLLFPGHKLLFISPTWLQKYLLSVAVP